MVFDFFARGTSGIPEILLQGMPEKEEKRTERLILGACRDTAFNREIGQVFLDIFR